MTSEAPSELPSEVPIPQPLVLPFVGNLLSLDLSSPGESLATLYKQYGEIYRLTLSDTAVTIVASQRLISELCDEERFRKCHTAPALSNLRPLAGDALFTAESGSAVWWTAHRILVPVFGPIGVAAMFPRMLDIALQMVDKFDRLGPTRDWLVDKEMTKLTIDTIGLTAFSYRLNSFYSDTVPKYAESMMGALTEAMSRLARPRIVDSVMFQTRWKFEADVAYMNSFCDTIIEERKRAYAAEGEPAEASRDLLDRMLLSADPVTQQRLTIENVRFQLNTFLVAGHETTSALLTFALYFLTRNHAVLQACEREIDEKLQGRVPTYAELKSIQSIQRVLNESLRLQPPVPIIVREPLARDAPLLGGKYRVPAGDRIALNIMALQRDPAVWGDRADEFLPDVHFAEGVQRPPHSFKAFGTGARACIGSLFALDEAALALVLLMQRFEFVHDPAYELRIFNSLTRKPVDFKLRFKRKAAVVGRSPAAHAPTATATTTAAADAAAAPPAVHGKPVHVLYGSNSGTCESFARAAAAAMQRRGVPATVSTLDAAVDVLAAQRDAIVVIVVSSYEGLPPSNAAKAFAWVEQASAVGAGLQFAVLGVGHRDWKASFMRVPLKFDAELARLGGRRLLPLGAADVAVDAFGAFDGWLAQLWAPLLSASLGDAAQRPTSAPSVRVERSSALRVDVVDQAQRRTALLQQSDLVPAIVVGNAELCGTVRDEEMPHHSVHHVVLQLPATQAFECGNYVAVLPVSPFALVQRALTRFGFSSETVVVVHATSSGEQARAMLPIGEPLRATVLLEQYVELTLPATRAQVELLAAHAGDAESKAALQAILDNFASERSKRTTLLELLEQFQRVAVDFGAFIDALPAIRPRLYSISSSPRSDPAQVSLTVDVLDRRIGAASTFLAHARQGDQVRVAVRASHSFVAPADEAPLLMIACGSGIAPFRGFVQHRALAPAGTAVGEAHLFVGHRHPQVDALYADELHEWQSKGVVSVHRAFSRIAGSRSKHVQDELWHERELVNRLLLAGTAHVFVCGSTELAGSVRQTLARIIAEQRNVSQEDADRAIADLQIAHRYAIDVFSPPA
jgi:cytochrome P450/NADPH-cytochrome P450 reductase